MKNTSLISYINKYIDDDYAMDVLYYSVKKLFVERKFSLQGFNAFSIDGRFLGDYIKISSNAIYRTPLHALACILSIRLLIIKRNYLSLCDGDNLIVVSKPNESFKWIRYMSLFMDNWEDDEVRMLYQMMENYYYDEEFKEDEKETFLDTILIPEFRNERVYLQNVAENTNGVSNNVIGNHAFLESTIEQYTVTKDIQFVGNTAFAFCDNLKTIEFEGKVMFGTFPIIECNNLKKIIVPADLLSYYKDCLPYYKKIVSDRDSDLPAESGIDEIEVEEALKSPIDINKLYTIFDNKATSYKYFWFIAIISLAKEKGALTIAYKDIVTRMAAIAWPIVFGDEIDLGNSDMLHKYLEVIESRTTLIKTASSKVVENYICMHYSSLGLDKTLSPLLKNVPYRFLSPWIKFTTVDDVIESSRYKTFNGMYALYPDHIIIDEDWWDYINANYSKICDFAKHSFITYAKKYNNDLKMIRFKADGWSLTSDNIHS